MHYDVMVSMGIETLSIAEFGPFAVGERCDLGRKV